MRINWVYANGHQIDPAVNIDTIKSIGPSWGSWKTWRPCQTDNVICHDLAKCRELMQRAFQAVCNFYIPRGFYQDLGRPLGTRLYDGDFKSDVDDIEDIIAMHLVAASSDLVLLTGFDLGAKELPADPLEKHKLKNRAGLIRSVIVGYPDVQWVLIDHATELDVAYQNLSNLTCDSLKNVLQLLL